jgi:hypothetical protein
MLREKQLIGEDMQGDDLDKALWGSFAEMYKGLTEEGIRKVSGLLTQFLHEHIDEIKQIAEKHSTGETEVIDTSKK